MMDLGSVGFGGGPQLRYWGRPTRIIQDPIEAEREAYCVASINNIIITGVTGGTPNGQQLLVREENGDGTV